MRQSTVKWFVYALFSGLLIISCASTKLTHTWVDKDRREKPVSNILVIAVADKEGIRRSFEGKFVAQLKAAGIEAVSSADVIPIPEDMKLEKGVILKAVNEFENDSVIITHLVGVEEKEVIHRASRPYRGYYGYYNYAHGYHYRPTYDRTHSIVRLETNLYDVKTEKLIWSGQSKTLKRDSDNQIIDELIEVMINDLHKSKLLPPK
jgi:hypothetical protein